MNTLKFGGYFSTRTGQPWTAYIEIVSVTTGQVVATSSSAAYPPTNGSSSSQEVWHPVSGEILIASAVPSGTYRFIAYVHDDANFDAAYVYLTNNPCPTVDNRCDNKLDKIKICHNGQTLCVAPSAVPAHLAHGDKLGSCDAPDPCSGQQNALSHIATTSNLMVYPNPADENMTIQYAAFTEGAVQLRLQDVMGKTILVQKQTVNKGQNWFNLNVSQLSAGMYWVEIYDNQQGVQTTRFMKR